MSNGDGPAKRHLSVDRFHRISPYKSHKAFRPPPGRSGPTRERTDVRLAARQLPAEPVAFELAPDPEDLAAESELEPSNAE